MPRYKTIEPAAWADMKQRWCLGQFATIIDLHRWAKQKYPTCPTIRSIQHKMSDDGDWVRGIADLKDAQRVAELTVRMFEHRDMQHSVVVDAIVCGIAEPTERIRLIRQNYSGTEIHEEEMDKILDLRKQQLPWIEQYKDFTGLVAPSKRVIEIDLEAKWAVCQDEACNEAYLRRFGRHPSQQVAVDAEVEKPKQLEVKDGKR